MKKNNRHVVQLIAYFTWVFEADLKLGKGIKNGT